MARRFTRTVNPRVPVWVRTGGTLPVTPPYVMNLINPLQAPDIPAGATITRVHLTIQATYSGVAGVVEDGIYVGLIVANQGLAPDELPKPTDQINSPWMYWSFLPLGGDSPFGAVAGTSVVRSWKIDNKSQRRMNSLNQTLWLCVDPEINSTPTALHASAAVLIKLP